jgi:hypothetical protein
LYCVHLDTVFAAKLVGIESYDISNTDPRILTKTVSEIRKTLPHTKGFRGDIRELYFSADYDLFAAKSLVARFIEQNIPASAFARLVHANAGQRRAKRIYFF